MNWNSAIQKVHIHEKIKTFNWNSAIEKVHIHEKIKTKSFAQSQKKKQIKSISNVCCYSGTGVISRYSIWHIIFLPYFLYTEQQMIR